LTKMWRKGLNHGTQRKTGALEESRTLAFWNPPKRSLGGAPAASGVGAFGSAQRRAMADLQKAGGES
jgi:hypothetical protein